MMLTSGVIQDGVIQDGVIQDDVIQDDVIQDTQDGNSEKLPSERQKDRQFYLLPCPFCGNIKTLKILLDDKESNRPGAKEFFFVACSTLPQEESPDVYGCGASSGRYESLDDAVSMWNARYGRPNDLMDKQNKLKEEVDA